MVASIIGWLSAAASVLYLAKQIQDSRRTVKAQFISGLEHEFTALLDTYAKLPGPTISIPCTALNDLR